MKNDCDLDVRTIMMKVTPDRQMKHKKKKKLINQLKSNSDET